MKTRKELVDSLASCPTKTKMLEDAMGLLQSGLTPADIITAVPELVEYDTCRLTSELAQLVAHRLLRYATIFTTQENA